MPAPDARSLLCAESALEIAITDRDIFFGCPVCRGDLVVDRDGAGMETNCFHCGASIIVPEYQGPPTQVGKLTSQRSGADIPAAPPLEVEEEHNPFFLAVPPPVPPDEIELEAPPPVPEDEAAQEAATAEPAKPAETALTPAPEVSSGRTGDASQAIPAPIPASQAHPVTPSEPSGEEQAAKAAAAAPFVLEEAIEEFGLREKSDEEISKRDDALKRQMTENVSQLKEITSYINQTRIKLHRWELQLKRLKERHLEIKREQRAITGLRGDGSGDAGKAA